MSSKIKSIGKKLKDIMEERRVTIDELYKETKIRKCFIEALLNGEEEKLPDKVFVIGFIKAICNYLKVDSKSLVEEYKSYKELDVINPPQKEKKRGIITISSLFIAFFVLLFFVIFLILRFEQNRVVEIETLKKEDIKKIPMIEKEVSKKEPVIEKQDKKELLELKANSRCYIELFDENKKLLLKREMSENEALSFKGKSFLITVGDSSAIEIFYEGKEIPIERKKGKVLRNIVIGEKNEPSIS